MLVWVSCRGQHLGFANATGVELSPSQVQLARAMAVTRCNKASGRPWLIWLTLLLIWWFASMSSSICPIPSVRSGLRRSSGSASGGRAIGHVPNGLSPFAGHVYWGDLTHLWCPVPASIQVFCRSSGLIWLGAFENIGASSGMKGRSRTLAWMGLRSLIAAVSTVETGRNAFALPGATFLFVCERSVSWLFA